LNGSLIVNPWNTDELAGAMHDAVTMSDEQRGINFQKLDKYVKKYTRYVSPFSPYGWFESADVGTTVVLSGARAL